MTKLTTVTENYTPSRNMDPFFTVKRLPLSALDFDGQKLDVNRDALFSPNGDMLGVVSKKYKVVENVSVANLFDEFFEKFHVHSVKDMVSGTGEKWVRDYILDDDKFTVSINGDDELKTKVSIYNGYNAKTSVGMSLSFWRQVCSNGLMGWKKEVSTTFSHFTDGIIGKLEKELEGGFSRVRSNVKDFEKWSEIPFGEKEFMGFVDSLDYMSDKKKEQTKQYYVPVMNKYGESETKWGAYNVLTAIATHHTNSRNVDVSNVFSSGYRQMVKVTKDFWNYKPSKETSIVVVK